METLKLLNREEVARTVDVHPMTITRWVKRGEFPPPVAGGYWTQAVIEAWQDEYAKAARRMARRRIANILQQERTSAPE